ncbi:MAG: type II and III secretion system protein [Bacteroidetes bacterium]|nr:type II and III secretion system protein [Bacteroidota bacterium]MBU1678464.1 type II and III secretion system protein [Bacteroidota bacterium]
MKKISLILILLCLTIQTAGQNDFQRQLGGYINPEELVTMAENIPFSKAIEVLNKVSEKISGRTILSTVNLEVPIGIQIERMPYMKALGVIVQFHNLEYEEKPTSIVVKSKIDLKSSLDAAIYAGIDTREVKISAVIFEANITDMQERGINWEWLLSKSGISIGTKLRTFSAEATGEGAATTTQDPPDFTLSTATEFNLGSFTGTAVNAFKFFESENLGEIIARPSISVRDKNEGKIQIGSNISIKERDFAGNLTDKFFETGTIVEVTPYIYQEEGIDYVLLKLMVEKSSAEPGVLSTEIRKTMASTEIIMLDGEQTVIGGLYQNEELILRRGIPFLKDLPWWVFGIKYLTGYDQNSVTKKEIIILIETEIIPSLKERLAEKKKILIKDELLKTRALMDSQKVNIIHE